MSATATRGSGPALVPKSCEQAAAAMAITTVASADLTPYSPQDHRAVRLPRGHREVVKAAKFIALALQ